MLAVAALLLVACAPDGDSTTTSTTDAPPAPGGPPPVAGTDPATTPAPAAPDDPTTAPVVTTALATTSPTGPGPDRPPAVTLEPAATADAPVGLAVRPGDEALYVVEQAGRVVRDGQVVVDLSGRVRTGSERGLLGLAFHPDEPFAYVNFTDEFGDTVVAEYPLGDDGTFAADQARVLFTVGQPHGNHNGGDLQFGPDGALYVGMGDGGSAGDPDRVAMDPESLLGKLLRVEPRSDPAEPQIWAVGLRNPWRFAFDPATGDLWVADVGQGAVEEIDRVAFADLEGANFGWSALEGDRPYNPDVEVPDPDRLVPPVHTYSHDAGCSVSGGEVYRGTAIPELAGWYVYGDYCAGTLWALDADRGREVVLATEVGPITAVRRGPDGELYVTTHGGDVLAIRPG